MTDMLGQFIVGQKVYVGFEKIPIGLFCPTITFDVKYYKNHSIIQNYCIALIQNVNCFVEKSRIQKKSAQC